MSYYLNIACNLHSSYTYKIKSLAAYKKIHECYQIFLEYDVATVGARPSRPAS